jgi:predicted RNase H-like HicB family nuclease
MTYAVIIDRGEPNYSAYAPDLPGCIATGNTLEDTKRLMREAMVFHLEGLKADGLPIPEPTTLAESIEAT